MKIYDVQNILLTPVSIYGIMEGMSQTRVAVDLFLRAAEKRDSALTCVARLEALLRSTYYKILSLNPEYWRTIRRNAGFTQAQVAAMAGTTQPVVHAFEGNRKTDITLCMSRAIMINLVKTYTAIQEQDLSPWNSQITSSMPQLSPSK